MVYINIALFSEGPTDQRFLKGIIKRTIEDIYTESNRDAIVEEPFEFDNPAGENHVEKIVNAAIDAEGWVLVVYHTDADNLSLDEAYKQRIGKGIEAISNSTENLNRNIVPCIPKNMIENWILSDKDELKENLGTNERDANIGMNYSEVNVESLGHGKNKLNEIINKVNLSNSTGRAKKRLGIDIGELYEPKGKEISLHKLKQLSSYTEFRQNIIDNLRKQNLLEGL